MVSQNNALTRIITPFQDLWNVSLTFIPIFISALIVFVIGLIIATTLGMLIEKILQRARLDNMLRQLGIERYFERAGISLNSARFLGQLVFWFITIAFLLASFDILGLKSISDFLRQVVLFIPNVIVAVLILLAVLVIANFTRKAVRASVKSAKMPGAHFLGTLSWWAIVVFGILAALEQLNIAPNIIQTLVTGFIAMIALAGGLAFGLGGKEYAADLIRKLREHTEER